MSDVFIFVNINACLYWLGKLICEGGTVNVPLTAFSEWAYSHGLTWVCLATVGVHGVNAGSLFESIDKYVSYPPSILS